jgi:RHS repeat-associated protein
MAMVDGAQDDRFAANAWSARNQLIAISGGVAANFQYDAFGRRVSKTVAGTTQYLYDGVNPVQELSGASVSANLLTGLGVDEYFQRTDANGPANFLTDALGGTIALTGGSGNTLASYTYEPFGNTSVSGSSSNPYQFTGRENDGTGLYFLRARYYSPTHERFISEDQLRFSAGVNFYSYASNDPVDFLDPLGLDKNAPCSEAPNAPSPQYYQSVGEYDEFETEFGPLGRLETIPNLLAFHRGGSLDAQAYGPPHSQGYTNYANYAFGVYMSTTGYSLSQTLSIANTYGYLGSNYPPNTAMDPNYQSIPAVNVANITAGWNAQ